MSKQQTLCKEVSVSGRGLHTGVEVTLTLCPAPIDHGIRFQRTDIEGQPVIDAIGDRVTDTSRGTTIAEGSVRVSTIEHVMAALYGMGIDNALVKVDGPETPTADGSSSYFVRAIEEAGIAEQEAERQYYIVKEPITYKDETRGVEITIYPDDHFSLDVMVDYNSKVLGHQYAVLKDVADFKREISPCRTFVFLHEVEILLQHNLIKGGDLDNAIVIIDRPVTQEQLDHLAQICNKPRIKVRPEGVLNNLKLHFENEPARHKLLDMGGDLALVGMPIKGRVVAARPGHYANTELVRRIRKAIRTDRKKADIPVYNPSEPPVMDIEAIKNVLPQRPPFLLIDKIIEKKEDAVVGIKNVTMNEPFFVGHFPEEAVMPGVLQIEAMAQVGGILLMDRLDDPRNYNSYFLRVDKVRFRRRVVPGDTLIIRVELGGEVRRGIAMLNGQIYVGDVLVTEGELMIQILKK
ncbi:MAG: bifunctional UDP-3-O-[3-hydroxymyristoyl] N-acetylglucosamine deacetylase/3-hydroxyacyl-ACP dehydratase [Bacteroidales bacterium]|nr:bifunctional UDP-3-O-[3-hydroxymyristoyl] N-acetylglucosamine deacetylase/3-hydroxyacyl-ACP dehydratase [Bacteroidales bacterium]